MLIPFTWLLTQAILQEPYMVFDKCEMERDFKNDQPTEEFTHNCTTLSCDTNIMHKIF